MTTVTTAPEAEYWLQTGWMEEPGAELGIHKPITIDRKTNLHEHRAYWCVRRAQDIFFSLLALIALSPLMLLTCIAVWIDSPGASPVFSQLRVGRNGKLFRLYKFRSMCPNAESKLNDLLQDNEMDGPVFKMKDDPRITRVGHFIRKTSIDELPQLVNILKGDMSIVGPRPALPREVAQYTPYEWQRLYVTPGLSCYWQIAPHRNQLSFEEWMALDVKYVWTGRSSLQPSVRCCSATENNSDHRSAEPAGFADLFFIDSLQETKNRGTTRGRPSVFA